MLLSFCGGNGESNPESSPVVTTNEKPVIENQENTGEDFNYDLLLTFSDCVNENGLEISIPIYTEDSNLPVIFELEGASALEEMPDMNMRMNAISNCESYLIEAGKNSEVINNLLRYLFEVVLMPPSMQADINDRPVGASEPPNDSPQNSVEGGESVQGSGEINWWDSESVNAQLEMSNTEVCNEYGCITIRTKADRWPDGLIEAEYGISHSSYIGYIDREIKPDNINFNSLSPLEKVARWAAQSTVTVIADRCFDSIGNKIILSTNPYTGFFISNDYVMTHSENLGTLKEKEAAGAYLSGDFGDPNGYGGMYNCMDYQENFNNDPVNIAGGPEFRVENVEGEGTFVQLFDETFGVGEIVYNKDNIAIIKIKYLPVESPKSKLKFVKKDNFFSITFLFISYSSLQRE